MYYQVLVSKSHHNFVDIQPQQITMKLDSIVFQFVEVIDRLQPTLLSKGTSVSITDFPRWWLCEETWQPRSLEVHDLNVEYTDSGIKTDNLTK